jgi:ABC-type transport system substrate-binding protein
MKPPYALAIVMATVVTVGCRAAIPEPSFAPGAMVLRMALSDDVPTLDPAAGYDTLSWQFEQMIFDTLVRYGDADVQLHPDLATSWTVSPDARTFTFRMRRDAFFTDGQPVTSADIRYAIERILSPRTHSQGMEYFRSIQGASEFVAGQVPHVAGIEMPDRWTIRFRLVAPDPLFADKLAMPFAAAVPKKEVERWGVDFARHPVGSGPFKLLQWIGGQRIVLVKNPHYFIRGTPRLDEELEWLKFEAGEIDISSIPPAEFPYVMRTPSLRRLTVHRVTASTNYLGMNCQMAPFNDARVRRALNYAINKSKLIQLLNGRGVIARGVLPPGIPGFNPGVAGYPYDPARSRKLLQEAGYTDHLRPELWLAADQTMMTIGESIQQDLALVGVDIILKPVAWAPLLSAVRQPRNVDLFLLGWEADFPDPSNFLEVLLSRPQWGDNNDTFYANPSVDALLDAAAPLTDLAQRYALYDRAEQIVIRDAPWVFLYHRVSWAIRQPWVNGLELSPMRPTRFDQVWLSPHGH